MNQVIQERIAALRKVMEREGVDYYMVPTADFHNSEYVDQYFKMREYLSGFTGSNGTLVVSAGEAGLWTDGRYFIQAENELKGTGIRLFRMLDEGVPTIQEYLQANMKEGQTLGFDGRVVDTAFGCRLEKALSDKKIIFAYDKDLADEVWADRPGLPSHPVIVLEEAICGRTAGEKMAEVRSAMEKEGTDAFLLSKLDDIMWLFNIRGGDVECNPVALSYAYLTAKECFLFIQETEVTDALREHAAKYGIVLKKYDETADFLKNRTEKECVLYDGRNTSYALYRTLTEKGECRDAKNPTELMKAVKNEVELAHMEEVYLKDSAAVCRFIYWLKKNVGKIPMTEISASDYLESLRREQEGLLDLSFDTICGYADHGAIVHYAATPESDVPLKPEGLLLVDSGGHYLEGTTDITRTFALGPVTEEMKADFTRVCRSNMNLANARFLYGCSGMNLDIIAREPFWEAGLDFKHGTGHGVGYVLNVHEGPNAFRYKGTEDRPGGAVFEEGMVTTDEPGIYIEGKYGIRLENELVCQKGEKNEYGQFMYFENLTYVPFDLDAIDPKQMTEVEKKRLNDYHANVYKVVSPYLQGEELAWLKEATRAI